MTTIFSSSFRPVNSIVLLSLAGRPANANLGRSPGLPVKLGLVPADVYILDIEDYHVLRAFWKAMPAKHMNSQRVDLILQYALVVAGENEEPYDRQLGPIHLIKYVYLADLAYSQNHEGETFTGAKWRFHKFGPWEPGVNERVEPALSKIGAYTTRMGGPKYEDDSVRWRPREDGMEKELSNQLPFAICVAVKNAVRMFGSDTAELLNHVYLTEPMLCAAPGEDLDFKCKIKPSARTDEIHPVAPARSMTKKERDERKQRFETLRSLVRERLNNKKKEPELVTPDPPPRYDEVFQQGMKCLEAEAGPPIEPKEEKAGLSNDIWKSSARYDPEIP